MRWVAVRMSSTLLRRRTLMNSGSVFCTGSAFAFSSRCPPADVGLLVMSGKMGVCEGWA